MTITINGSGTVTGITAGGLPDAIITTDDIADANITAAKLSGAQNGSAPIYAARAWVNFNGTGTVAIRGSGNVSSITDNGVGLYTVNFTTAMPDTNYTATSGIGRTYTSQSAGRSIDLYSFTTTSLSVTPFNDQLFTTDDVPYVAVTVFR